MPRLCNSRIDIGTCSLSDRLGPYKIPGWWQVNNNYVNISYWKYVTGSRHFKLFLLSRLYQKNLQQEVANKVKRVTCQAMSKIATINWVVFCGSFKKTYPVCCQVESCELSSTESVCFESFLQQEFYQCSTSYQTRQNTSALVNSLYVVFIKL